MARKRTRNRIAERSEFDELDENEGFDEEDDEEDEDLDADLDEDEDEAEEEEEKPKKPKKPAKKPTTRRTRTPKVTRRRAVWVVFDNSSKPIKTFSYAQRKDAEAFLEEKNSSEKKTGFYLQMIKEEIEEK